MPALINYRVNDAGRIEPDDRAAEIDRLRNLLAMHRRALGLARTAIFEAVRSPMGVMPDSAHEAFRAIDRALEEGER